MNACQQITHGCFCARTAHTVIRGSPALVMVVREFPLLR